MSKQLKVRQIIINDLLIVIHNSPQNHATAKHQVHDYLENMVNKFRNTLNTLNLKPQLK